MTSDVEIIDLDGSRERAALGSDHRSTQLVQHQPRRLIAPDAELALQLHAEIPG